MGVAYAGVPSASTNCAVTVFSTARAGLILSRANITFEVSFKKNGNIGLSRVLNVLVTVPPWYFCLIAECFFFVVFDPSFKKNDSVQLATKRRMNSNVFICRLVHNSPRWSTVQGYRTHAILRWFWILVFPVPGMTLTGKKKDNKSPTMTTRIECRSERKGLTKASLNSNMF